ncbi:MAG: EscS/YscS/HrcS family type III secretion system export apparatus protein [Desulfobacteraceae bacterium]|nr:EscS/YscS/HrcS family type III secretion system export apparatus protein [Desulfobacteraceae bacterium]
MIDPLLIRFTVKALILILMLSLPPIIVAAVTGILVSLFQAVTQVQEQTISFAVKLVAVIITIMLTSRWIGGEILSYAVNIYDTFPVILK